MTLSLVSALGTNIVEVRGGNRSGHREKSSGEAGPRELSQAHGEALELEQPFRVPPSWPRMVAPVTADRSPSNDVTLVSDGLSAEAVDWQHCGSQERSPPLKGVISTDTVTLPTTNPSRTSSPRNCHDSCPWGACALVRETLINHDDN